MLMDFGSFGALQWGSKVHIIVTRMEGVGEGKRGRGEGGREGGGTKKEVGRRTQEEWLQL